jgi:hypothetical protein
MALRTSPRALDARVLMVRGEVVHVDVIVRQTQQHAELLDHVQLRVSMGWSERVIG